MKDVVDVGDMENIDTSEKKNEYHNGNMMERKRKKKVGVFFREVSSLHLHKKR